MNMDHCLICRCSTAVGCLWLKFAVREERSDKYDPAQGVTRPVLGVSVGEAASRSGDGGREVLLGGFRSVNVCRVHTVRCKGNCRQDGQNPGAGAGRQLVPGRKAQLHHREELDLYSGGKGKCSAGE